MGWRDTLTEDQTPVLIVHIQQLVITSNTISKIEHLNFFCFPWVPTYMCTWTQPNAHNKI